MKTKKEPLEAEAVKVAVGHDVPDFKAEAFHGNKIKKIKLSDYKDQWVVVFFYPADFTFVCPTELEELAHNYSHFKKLNTEILAVSVDTVYVHKAWHDHSPAIKKVDYPMLADPKHELCELFGTYIPEEGVSLRGTFIIGPGGVLKAMEVNDNSIGRSARELLRKLQAAQFVAKNSGKVCPASWEPGKDTLEPGLNLVGKI
jgi:peroxiredoxin (alkyl hydroperoxide reductase subunit C)